MQNNVFIRCPPIKSDYMTEENSEKREFILDSVPHAPPTIVPKSVAPGVWLLLDPDTPNWVVVDDIGKEIIGLISGTQSVREITTVLCEKYGGPYDESAQNILAFVNDLGRRYFLRDDVFPEVERKEWKDVQLEEFWLHVTNQCNLRCIHCHLSSGLPLKNELAIQEIFRITDEARELGAEKAIISGGEPFLRKDVLDILGHISEYFRRITFVTNGTLITEDIASNLSGYSNVMVQVSLDGAREETNDFIRGKGSYRKTVRGIEHLVTAQVPCVIAMTLVKQNLNEISEMVDLAKTFGLNHMHFPILQVKGRAKESESEVVPENEAMVSAVKEIFKIPRTEGTAVSLSENFFQIIRAMQKKDLCGAGKQLISIAADGRVYPCPGLHEDEFCAGSLLQHSLKEIYETSDIFNQLRSLCVLDIPECRPCEFKFICGGGCHVDRYHAYGHLKAPTPRCEAHQQIYSHLLVEEAKKFLSGG